MCGTYEVGLNNIKLLLETSHQAKEPPKFSEGLREKGKLKEKEPNILTFLKATQKRSGVSFLAGKGCILEMLCFELFVLLPGQEKHAKLVFLICFSFELRKKTYV